MDKTLEKENGNEEYISEQLINFVQLHPIIYDTLDLDFVYKDSSYLLSNHHNNDNLNFKNFK